MRRLAIVFLAAVSMRGILLAQTEPLTASFSPAAISVNALNAAVFDPVNSGSQPILTNLLISNVSSAPVAFNLSLVVTWNNPSHQLASLTFPTLYPIQPGEQWNISNRDFITDQQGFHFGEPAGRIDIIQLMKVDPILNSALEAGRFPDGKLIFTVDLIPLGRQLRAVSATFVVSISNITSIFPTYPGKPAGLAPPKVNLKPVTFLWNSMITSFNTFHLTIKEFEPGTAPNANFVESAGRTVFDGDVGNNIFSEFLPFQNQNYYAWQIQTTLVNESNFQDVSRSRNYLISPWYVFQYDDSYIGNDTSNQELTALLNMLNNPAIRALLNAGFSPTGTIIQEGNVFTGQDAIDLVNTLVGKTIAVEITEQ